MTVRGKDLRTYLESFVAHGAPRVHVSGVVIRYDLALAAGARIVSATIGGAPIDDTRVLARSRSPISWPPAATASGSQMSPSSRSRSA